METFRSNEVELLLRPEKKGAFGCMVLFEMPAATPDEALRDAISRIDSLTIVGGSRRNQVRTTWRSSTAPAGSKVLLTVYDKTPRQPIIALESKGGVQ